MKNKKQIDGKFETNEPSTINEIWGDSGIGRYKTLDISEYSNFLQGLNRSDLQSHAIEIGLIPIDNHAVLTKRLLDAFKVHVGSFRRPKNSIKGQKTPNKEVLDILSEGR